MIINRLLQLPVRAWRSCAAPLLPPTCRFYPSCSAYAMEALERHAWWRALGLIAWRLLRCQPFSAGGFDPVPAPPGAAPQSADTACTCGGAHGDAHAPAGQPADFAAPTAPLSPSSHARLNAPHG